MKRFLIFAATCAFAFTVFQSSKADVSINFFYDNLNGGNWYEVADYGYVWQPDVATNPDWRPYTDGYWAYTDVGWTWVSYEDFGWATYHYGRWIRLEDYGWCWVPGYEWGPAWVSWRTGGDYLGWAPLPPAGPRSEIVYESRPIGGHVDVDFDIGPAYYNFIDIRFIGEPVLIGHYYPYTQNVVYINNTVNVTNITYNNSVVYNYGPDYAVLSRYSTRPIQRLKLERASIDPVQAIKSGTVTRVQGDKLVLAAPMKLQKPTAQAAPKAIKAKIAQPKVERGWANISDPGAKAKLEQKFKTENPKNIPPPTIQPKAATANLGAAASPGASSLEKGKGKHKGETMQNQPAVTAGTSPAATAMPFEQGKGRKGKGQKFDNEAAASATAGGSPMTESGDQGKGKHKGQRFENESDVSGEPGSALGENEPGRGNKKGQKFENDLSSGRGSSETENPEQGRGRKKGHERGEELPGYGSPMTPQDANGNRGNQRDRGKHRGNEYYPPGSQDAGGNTGAPAGYGGPPRRHDQPILSQGQPRGGQDSQQGGQQGGQGQDQSRGKGKKVSPTPTPQ